MSMAAVTCTCGMWVTLRLDSDDQPVSWSLLGPELFADATDEPATEPVDKWSAEIAEHAQRILNDADEFTEQVGRARVARGAFSSPITCACGREYAALNVRPWIVEATDS